jgi:hypothetical protein
LKPRVTLAELALCATAAGADWKHVFLKPDLSLNHDGNVHKIRIEAIAPVAEASRAATICIRTKLSKAVFARE